MQPNQGWCRQEVFLASCTPELRAQAGVDILFCKGLAVTFHGEGQQRECGLVPG